MLMHQTGWPGLAWPTHLGEQGQDGDASVATDNGHVHGANVQASALGVEGLGTDLGGRAAGGGAFSC